MRSTATASFDPSKGSLGGGGGRKSGCKLSQDPFAAPCFLGGLGVGAGLVRGGCSTCRSSQSNEFGRFGKRPGSPSSREGGVGRLGRAGGWTSSAGTGRLFKSREMVLSLCPFLPRRAAASDDSLSGAC